MSNTNDSGDDLMAALNFDPFSAMGSQDTGGDQGSQQAPQNSAPAQQPQYQAPATGTTLPNQAPVQQPAREPAPQNQAPAGQQPQGQVPQNSVAQFMESINRMGAMPPMAPQLPQGMPQYQQPQAPQQQQPAPQGQQQRVDYSQPYQPVPVEIPQPLLQAVMGQDANAAAQALNQIVGTVYNSLAQRFHQEFGAFQGQLQQLPQQIMGQTQMAQGQQQLRDKFYGKHPELNNPMGQYAVAQITNQVASAYQRMGVPFDPMSDEFLDYIGAQARTMANIAAPQQQVPQNQGRPPQRPPQFQTPGASRAGGGGGNPFMDAIGFSNFGS